MTQPTPTEIVLLRTRDQRTELYLSIYHPKVVFAAQVNDPNINPGVNLITFDNVTSGVYTAIKSGMTLYIGSTPGGVNYGRIRVRSAKSTILTIAENSDINWKDNLYLTIKDFYEVWSVRQTVQTVGNTPATDEVLVYKDTDIAYTNQNEHPGSLIWMGSHKAGWIENGHCQFYWSATGTVNTAGDTLTYSWAFEGGNPATSSDATPGLVDYTTAGHYVARLDVTSSNGTVDTSYRYVSVYDDAHQPINEWGMDDLKGSRNEGAYTTNIWIRQPVNDIVEGAMVVIFSKSCYGVTPYSFNRNIEFVGYILNDSITYDYQQSKVEFSVGSIIEAMKDQDGQGTSVTSTSSPSSWSEMGSLTIQKAIWWFLRWHTTILSLADVEYLGNNFFLYAFEPDPTSLYDTLSSFMKNRLLGTVAANRQGQIILEVDPSTIHHAPTVIPLGMRLDRQDWKGTPDIKESTKTIVNYLEMGGYDYSEGIGTGVNTPYLACAPGTVPSYFGKVEEDQEVILSPGQDYLSTLVGDVFAYRNARYPEISLSMAGNYGNIEFIPSERYLLTVEAKDSQSRVEVNDLPVHPIELIWRFVPEKSYFSVDGVFHELTEGISGTYLPIPQSPLPNPAPEPIPPDIPWVPLTGTPPWPNPIVPPLPVIPPSPPGFSCKTFYSEFNANGPYYIYPDSSTLGPGHLSTVAWFPCWVRNDLHPKKTTVVVSLSGPVSFGYIAFPIFKNFIFQGFVYSWVPLLSSYTLASVSAIDAGQRVIMTVPCNEYGQAVFVVPTGFDAAGFKLTSEEVSLLLNCGVYHDHVIGGAAFTSDFWTFTDGTSWFDDRVYYGIFFNTSVSFGHVRWYFTLISGGPTTIGTGGEIGVSLNAGESGHLDEVAMEASYPFGVPAGTYHVNSGFFANPANVDVIRIDRITYIIHDTGEEVSLFGGKFHPILHIDKVVVFNVCGIT